jgi:transposase
MWYTGIDWADEHHDALTIDEQGHQMGSIRVDHTPQGLTKLDHFLMQIIGSAPKEHMACIIETIHGLLIAHLLEAGWPVYPVNPRTVDRRRSASGAKTDLIDAYLLAKTGRADFADLHRLTPDSDKVAELKQLTRDQDTLIRTQTRLVNQLTACLKAYYPVALDLFSKLQQKSTLLFLQAYPTVEAARAASLTELQQQLQHTRHPHQGFLKVKTSGKGGVQPPRDRHHKSVVERPHFSPQANPYRQAWYCGARRAWREHSWFGSVLHLL